MDNQTTKNTNIIIRHPLAAYYLITLAISWTIFFLLGAVKQGWIDLPIPFSIH